MYIWGPKSLRYSCCYRLILLVFIRFWALPTAKGSQAANNILDIHTVWPVGITREFDTINHVGEMKIVRGRPHAARTQGNSTRGQILFPVWKITPFDAKLPNMVRYEAVTEIRRSFAPLCAGSISWLCFDVDRANNERTSSLRERKFNFCINEHATGL